MKLVRTHTERFTKETLHSLFDTNTRPCVSIYMPTHKISNEAEQDPIRLKNLLSKTEKQLKEQGMNTLDIDNLLNPIQALVDDREFWTYQSHGLAIFRTPERFEQYRLPISFDELVTTNDRFHIKPLLPLLSGNGRFYLLSLSQNEVKLFEGTRFRIGNIELGDDIPTSLDEAMRFDDFESKLQSHTSTGQRAAGSRNAMFHGMEDAGDEAVIKENLKRFFRSLDNGVNKQINEEKAPLILAGVEYMRGIYREVSGYDYILQEGVEGNPERLMPKELHQQAWPIVEPHFQQAQSEATDTYLHLKGSGDERASATLDEIISAAYFQRIDTLFIANNMQYWGDFDAEENSVKVHTEKEPRDNDLLDFAATYTILNGGTVYAQNPEEMPDGAEIAAIFRY